MARWGALPILPAMARWSMLPAMARWSILLAVALSSAAVAPVAVAQVADESKKAEAIKHFEIGLDLVKQEAWDSALAEFLRSRELYPTRNALRNAAVCLRELKRFDEALDMYDELLARFGGELTPVERAAVDEDQKKLGKFVGTLTIQTDTAGARVVVDGRERGVTPLAKPIRVTVGTRAITISKEGFAPFETKVMVSSGDSKVLSAKLASVANAGKLRVTEARGRAFEVVLDGAVVGTTPWEGTVAAGTHTVALRGPADEGAVAKPVQVVADKSTDVSFEAAKLPGELRVDPTPSDAEIFVDGKKVGAGPFKGELAAGSHVITVTAPWHREQSRLVTSVPGRSEAMSVSLDPIRRLYFELQPVANPLSFPSGTFASPDRGGAGGSGLFGGMLRSGFKLHPHFAIELGAGFARWTQMRSADGLRSENNVTGNLIDESIRYQGPMVMVSGAAHFGDSFPIVLRAVTGLWFAEQHATGGKFSGTNNPFDLPNATNSAVCAVFGPEARFGVRLSRATTIDLGVLVLAVRCDAHDFGPRTSSETGDSIKPNLRTETVALLWAPTLGVRLEL